MRRLLSRAGAITVDAREQDPNTQKYDAILHATQGDFSFRKASGESKVNRRTCGSRHHCKPEGPTPFGAFRPDGAHNLENLLALAQNTPAPGFGSVYLRFVTRAVPGSPVLPLISAEGT